MENFHSNLITIITGYCLDAASEWGDAIDLLLFSVRGSMHESPFHLIFCHQFRGPLKDCWLDEDDSVPVATKVKFFKNRLQATISYFHAHFGKAQSKTKKYYNEAQ